MSDNEQTNETDTAGKEDNNKPTEKDEKNNSEIGETALDRAESANKEKERLIEEEKKLMDRKEKLHAMQMVGGHTITGQEHEKPKEETDQEYSDRIDKEIREGKTNDFK